MRLPPLLLGAVAAFWGWRSGHWAAAAALALALEAPRAVSWRLDLRHGEFSRIADACTVAFVALLVWLFATVEPPRTARAVLTALLWLPVVLAPLVLAQRFSSAGTIPVSALFLYLRKLKAREPETPDPDIDLSGIYLALCLVAAGIPNTRDELFYAGVVLLAAWALAAVRPRYAPLGAWAGAVLLAAGIGYGAHRGLAGLQAAVESWVGEWLLRGLAADPYRASSDLGSVGRLKEIESIVLRVYADPAAQPRIRLLHRASYTSLAGSTWLARNAPMAQRLPEADGTTWRLGESPPERRLRIATRLEKGKALLALPANTVRLSELPAASVLRNALGATSADLGGDWVTYVAESGPAAEDYAPPRGDDLELPPRERAAFARLAEALALQQGSAAERLARVQGHFASAFRYSTYRAAPPPAGTTPLEDFLERSRSGHCEYFAAATVLALRAGGIPARYAVGFAVVEHSALEEAYVVRARHAHAWARAWVDGRWIDVDTTPPSWVLEEESRAPPWQALLDLLRWATFRWSQRGAFEGGPAWTGAAALLALVLAWRLLRGKRASRPAPARAARRAHPGDDSELYALFAPLEARFGARAAGETLQRWISRTPVAGELREALELHYRYRFDPRGLDPAERAALRARCLALAQSLH